MRRAKLFKLGLIAATVTALLAACANDPLADQFRAGDNKNYIAGD